jgi:hypothetical protein
MAPMLHTCRRSLAMHRRILLQRQMCQSGEMQLIRQCRSTVWLGREGVVILSWSFVIVVANMACIAWVLEMGIYSLI